MRRYPALEDLPNFTTPDEFFERLAVTPLVRDRTIVTPHLYGPNVTGAAHSDKIDQACKPAYHTLQLWYC